MAIDFQNVNRWIASSGLNQVFSQPAASKTSDKAQSEKKGSPAAWITNKTAQIALGAIAVLVTGTAVYYASRYLGGGFNAADALANPTTPSSLDQDKPTGSPAVSTEALGTKCERFTVSIDDSARIAVNRSSAQQNGPFFPSSHAESSFKNDGWNYPPSRIKPILVNQNIATHTLPSLDETSGAYFEDPKTDAFDTETIEFSTQSGENVHFQDKVKPESPMMPVSWKLSNYALPVFGALFVGGVISWLRGSSSSTSSTSTAPNEPSTPASAKSPRASSPGEDKSLKSLYRHVLKNKSPGTPRPKICNQGTPASGLRISYTPTSIQSIRDSAPGSAASSRAENSAESSPVTETTQKASKYDWQYDFDEKALDESFDIYQIENLSTHLNNCDENTRELIRTRTPHAIDALETCFENTEEYLNELDDTYKNNFTKELEFFKKLKDKFKGTVNQSDVIKQYFETWLLIYNLHLFNSVSLSKLHSGPVYQKANKKLALQNADQVCDKFLREMVETLGEKHSATDALFAMHNYILSRAYSGIYDGFSYNNKGFEFTNSSLEQLYQYSVFLQTQFDLIYVSVQHDRESRSRESSKILGAFEDVLLKMIAKPEIPVNPLARITVETKEEAVNARPDLSTAPARHRPVDWAHSPEPLGSVPASPAIASAASRSTDAPQLPSSVGSTSSSEASGTPSERKRGQRRGTAQPTKLFATPQQPGVQPTDDDDSIGSTPPKSGAHPAARSQLALTSVSRSSSTSHSSDASDDDDSESASDVE